ncbi:MAG: hypothetical protein ABI700_01915 [Chloroflexota bacterium]
MYYTNETLLPTTPIQMLDLRKSLGELVERTHYQFLQFRIMRKDKPMARLVNEPYMQALETLVASDPAVAETLELLLDTEFMKALQQSEQDVTQRKLVLLEHLLET